MSDISTLNITYLPGVGPKKAEVLRSELKVQSYEDLLYNFPYKYVDRSRTYLISEIDNTASHIQLKGKVVSQNIVGIGKGQRLVVDFTDGTGVIRLVWFKYINKIKKGLDPKAEYVIFGKPSVFNNTYNIVHPEMEQVDVNKPKIVSALQAFYHTSERMKNSYLNSKAIQKMQQNVFLSFKGAISETIPAYILQQYKLMILDDALRTIHFPKDSKTLERAQFRLKFEELFYIQLNILKQKDTRRRNIKGHVFAKVADIFNGFFNNNLPFELTGAQKRVIREIRRDVGSGRQMNRLLQGDVGSGKTMVALMVMLIALDNNYQACLMAPTEILATQHLESIQELLADMPLNVKLLTGSTKKKERELIHKELLNGDLQILIGTHALLEDIVQFKNLGIVIVDEQHRFGVAQRAKLWRKNIIPPHVLVMTATPIPRTLAMTVYGDLDVSVIDELPPNRKTIETKHYFHNKRNNLNKFIRDEIARGRQIYVVYPLIEESEKMDFKNLTEGLEYMNDAFPEYKTTMVHGKMKPAEKDSAMQEFASGEAQILVATTVIEVGVNVPNASVMIIESAERFGLSQLHQLRGRVGRGAEQSYCILMTGYKMSEDTRKRMRIMVESSDGFEIAEADMKLRGPGDMEGTQQSGLPFDLKIANITRDSQLLQHARNVAEVILEKDPSLSLPENLILNKQLNKLAKQKLNWSLIS